MPTSAFNKFNCFVEDVAEKKHNLGSDALTVALTVAAPVATNTVLANLTPVAYTFLSTRALTISTSVQTTGTYKLTIADLVLTSTGGATGPFRYVTVYNDTATNKELIGWYDYGSAITLNDGETLTLDLDQAGGLLTIA